MAVKKPPKGQDLSQDELAAELEGDQNASVLGELDLGLDADPDLRTRAGQQSVLGVKREAGRKPPLVAIAVVVVVLGAAGAWLSGALKGLGIPGPLAGASSGTEAPAPEAGAPPEAAAAAAEPAAKEPAAKVPAAKPAAKPAPVKKTHKKR